MLPFDLGGTSSSSNNNYEDPNNQQQQQQQQQQHIEDPYGFFINQSVPLPLPFLEDDTFISQWPLLMDLPPPDNPMGWNYELVVAQQPVLGRRCGFGTKDRRPISPPPIVELLITTSDGMRVKAEDVDISFFVVLCDNWQADGMTEANVIVEPTKRNLVGSLVASAIKLYNVQGQMGIYFIFSDISVRLEGTYRLGFSLVDVRSPCMSPDQSSSTLSKIYTDAFTIYPAKSFPGVAPRTELSQCFLRQGVKIPVRKEDDSTSGGISSCSSKKKRPASLDEDAETG
ncbi:velvet factor-domain-containing protein [Zychaea mexicana]|uniref:velvet factor-domain-containing protein n=1 Tax=Zychaea mexicana TaxID=64656 RepID=UPI0022FE38A7|nr:velvet factor-domain-containing protein [Zychaea mexicana]KAI9489219.1 velvet factor-domain-containing protein [Zychaea mexicana]